jgi:hypothetical protein
LITIEMIDEFRRRTNCSYDDAKYYLEKYNGDMLEAIIAFERDRNRGYGYRDERRYSGYSRRGAGIGRKILNALQRLLDIRIVIADNTGRTFNIPILFPLVLIPVWHILLLIALGMMLVGYRFSIREVHDGNYDLNSIISRIREKSQAR